MCSGVFVTGWTHTSLHLFSSYRPSTFWRLRGWRSTHLPKNRDLSRENTKLSRKSKAEWPTLWDSPRRKFKNKAGRCVALFWWFILDLGALKKKKNKQFIISATGSWRRKWTAKIAVKSQRFVVVSCKRTQLQADFIAFVGYFGVFVHVDVGIHTPEPHSSSGFQTSRTKSVLDLAHQKVRNFQSIIFSQGVVEIRVETSMESTRAR